LKDLLDANPQFQQMLAFMDEKQLKRHLIDGLTTQELINQYVQEHGIQSRSDYQAELKRVYVSVENALNTHFFSQDFPVSVTDLEVTDFYEKNKQVHPELLVSRGGVRAAYVAFDKEADATKWLDQIKSYNGDLEKAAQATGVQDKFKDLRLVNAQSTDLDTSLRDHILNLPMDKGPEASLFKGQDGSFFVVSVSAKEEPKYRPLEDIGDNLKKYLEKQKRQELAERKVADLKREKKVQFNEAFFGAAESTPVTGLKA
jgi:hypothetical protein